MNFRDCLVHDWGYSNLNLNLNIKLSHSFKTPIIVFKRNYLKQNCCKKAMHENKNRTFQEVRSRELLDNFRGPLHAYAQQKKLPPIFVLFQFSYFTLLLRSCHSIFGGIANKREETFWTHIFYPLQKKIHQEFGGEMVGFILRVSNIVDRILSFRIFVTVTF